MTILIRALVIFFVVGVALWLISFAVEELRTKPSEPEKLAWGPDLGIHHTDLDGVKVRYIKTGAGPDLVLLHTLRTQLDIFQKMLPELQKHFTVYAVDYPGHGWSDIPNVKYDPNQFYEWAEKFLGKIDVQDATIAGISIGGTIVLELAARRNPRVAKAIAINPYDYPPSFSAGLKGSSVIAQALFTATDFPFIGETFMRLRNPFGERKIFEGGVADPSSISDELFTEFSSVGNRPGHYQAFISLLRERDRFQDARKNYPDIKVPVLLVFGDQDWATQDERARTRDLIPGVRMVIVKDGGHFLSLDQPESLQTLIIEFAKEP
jgi:pimeloyl-ACP methyl ester carboxylesterase